MSTRNKDFSGFPKEYDKSMGITHRQYIKLLLKAEQLFGSKEGIDKAYDNIPEDLLNLTKSTKEQVLWAFEEYLSDQSYHAKMVPVQNSSAKENIYTFKDEKIKNTLNAFDDLFKKGEVHEGIVDIVSQYKNGKTSEFIRQELNEYGKMGKAKSIAYPGHPVKEETSQTEPRLPDEPSVYINPNTGNSGR